MTMPIELLELTPTAAPPTDPVSPPAESQRTMRPWQRNSLVTIAGLAVAAWAIGGLGSRSPAPPTEAPTAVLGTAELAVTDYLTSRHIDGTGIPGRFVTQATALDADFDPAHGWTVEVDVEVLILEKGGYREDGRHRYIVAIVEASDGPVATALPVRVSTPETSTVPAIVVGSAVTDEHLLALAAGFLDAYLVGTGDLRSYVTGTSRLEPMTPTPYRRVTTETATIVPDTDHGAHLTVTGTAIHETGAPLPIEYHLLVSIESGTWRVDDITAGPPLLTNAAADHGVRPP